MPKMVSTFPKEDFTNKKYCATTIIYIFFNQVKQLYNKITGQAESLKGLWVAKLNLKGRSALATAMDLQSYDNKKTEV